MGAVAIHTQCCMQQMDDETDEEDAPREKVLVEPVPWYSGCGPLGAPSRPQDTVQPLRNNPRPLSSFK